MELDYSISPGQCCGLGSPLSDLFGLLPGLRCLLGSLIVLARRQVSKDAELLVLRHQHEVLHRQIGRVRYQPGDRLWLAALSRLILRRRQGEYHLRRVLSEYLRHYNAARPHRALGQLAPAQVGTWPQEINLAEPRIRRKQVLGGLIHEYQIAA
jgi:hypothetical protein